MSAVNVTRKDWVWQALKPGNFAFWLSRAQPGQKLIYHIGNLAADRAKIAVYAVQGRMTMTTKLIEPLNSVALEVWQAYEHGLVTLTQKRLGENLFQYEARMIAARPALRRVA